MAGFRQGPHSVFASFLVAEPVTTGPSNWDRPSVPEPALSAAVFVAAGVAMTVCGRSIDQAPSCRTRHAAAGCA